jgi:hypothetical protein
MQVPVSGAYEHSNYRVSFLGRKLTSRLWPSSSMRCSVIPFHIVILFQGQNYEISFHHQSWHSVGSHTPWQYATDATAMTHPRVPFCAHPSAFKEPSHNKLSGILKSCCQTPSCITISLSPFCLL